jgi:protein-L-isoaspartate(D-aspartate) O-methyltransferase
MTISEARPGSGLDAQGLTMAEDGSSAARRRMIDSQLRTSGVNEPWVLERFAAVAREDFVPASARAAAYIDRAVPLDQGRWLAAPLFHGMMLSEAKPNADDKVLLVSGGSGYLAALVEPLVATLDVVDPGEAVVEGRGQGDYTLLLIDGAIEVLPEALAARLADNGRLVTGHIERGVTRLATGRKAAGSVALFPLAEIGIPPLPEFAAPKRWSF